MSAAGIAPPEGAAPPQAGMLDDHLNHGMGPKPPMARVEPKMRALIYDGAVILALDQAYERPSVEEQQRALANIQNQIRHGQTLQVG